jgi:hypothetical protein
MDREALRGVGLASRLAMVAPVALALLCSCSSSERYTVPAAAINTALGLGVAAQQRAAGACFAECVYGTSCNPRTGLCERSPCGTCPTGESCVASNEGWRCLTGEEAGKITAGVQATLPAPVQVVPGVGISPRTGSGPPEPYHPGPDRP